MNPGKPDSLSNFGHEAAGLGVAYLLLFVASQILTGMLTVVIGRSVLGDRITAGEAWHRTLPRLPALFGATILYFLIIFGPWAVYLGIGLFMAAARRGRWPAPGGWSGTVSGACSASHCSRSSSSASPARSCRCRSASAP